jgi:protein TonB
MRGGGGVGTAPAVSRGLTLAAPGTGDGAGSPGTEYGPYLARLRERVQGTLRYPPAARRRGLEGTVALEIVIRPDGTLGGVAVADSSAYALLDDAALEAVRRLAPEPFPPGVAPRLLRVRLPVVFMLR